MHRIATVFAVAAACSSVAFSARGQVTAVPVIEVPAFTAYSEPDPDAIQVSQQDGITGWTDSAQKLVWYGYLKNPGTLTPDVRVTLPVGETTTLKLTVAGLSSEAEVAGAGAAQCAAMFKSV